MTTNTAAFPKTTRLVDQILDVLPVTDRVFHDLRHTEPLVVRLIERVAELRASGSVLVIGPNALLPEVVIKLGYSVDLWQLRHTILSDDTLDHVTRAGTLDELLDHDPERPYDVVVLPYILEKAIAHPTAVLARLRPWIAPGGHILVAYRPSDSLDCRLAALTGRSVVPDPSTPQKAVSYSWPTLLTRRIFGSDELRDWSVRTGLRIGRQERAVDRRAVVAIHALGIWP